MKTALFGMVSVRAAVALGIAFLAVASGAPLNPRQAVTRSEARELRERVRAAFFHGWDAYLAHGFPADELMPLECRGRSEKTRGFMDDTLGRFALTLVDSLDTLAVMGEWDEFENAVGIVVNNVSFCEPEVVSVFETNIRVLGGLLSAHLLAVDNVARLRRGYNGELLSRALEIGERLLPAFSTPTGIPCARVHLVRGVHCDSQEVTTAEAGTLLLEFGLLSLLSGRPEFKNAADRSLDAIWSRKTDLDMVGTTIDIKSGLWKNIASSIGAGVDSFYEYLYKSYILFGDSKYLRVFRKAYNAMLTHGRVGSLYYSVHAGTGEIVSDSMQNLAMFWPGLQVLVGDVEYALEYYFMNAQVVVDLGFPPESFFIRKGRLILSDSGYVLRPEFVESTLLLYRATKDPVFLMIGREILSTLDAFCRISCGYAAVGDLSTMRLQDRLDTFFFSETLKYLYLLFDESNFIFNKPHIFTTQAHVIPISGAHIKDIGSRRSPPPSYMTVCKVPGGFNGGKSSVFLSAVYPLVDKYAKVTEDKPEKAVLQIRSKNFGSLSMPASLPSFGRSVPSDGVRGKLSSAHPAHGCTALAADLRRAIGFVWRGDCTFVEKILNVQRANGIAAVVADNTTEALFTMSKMEIEGKNIAIPSVLISKESGERIASWLALGEDIEATLTTHRRTK